MSVTRPQTNARQFFDFQHFPRGVNSFVEPQLLSDQMVRWAENAVCKGGIWKTRPGYKTRHQFDLAKGTAFYTWWIEAGQPTLVPQFMVLFTPSESNTYLVFGISGTVFQCKIQENGELASPVVIDGLQFSPNADQMVAVETLKSIQIVQGIKTAIPPQRYLIIQDGLSRAGYWNGSVAGQLNPTQSITVTAGGDTIYDLNANQTPIGLWMAWSGNRLWVANGSQVYASDANDPLYFTEQQVLTQIPVFNFDRTITGIADRGTAGSQAAILLIYTNEATYSIRSGIQDRTVWINVEDFQKKIFDGIGCVAGKSIIANRGLLYWYSQEGVIEFDSIGTQFSTQALDPIDNEQLNAKRLAQKYSTACVGSYDAYVFWSTPAAPVVNGMTANRVTQVLDKATVPTSGTYIPAWQGVWTGINPVEWACGHVYGIRHAYALCLDDDGVIRIWEAFQGNRCDNGNAIPWHVEFKTVPVSNSPFQPQIFRHVAVRMLEIVGDLSVKLSWKGTRGNWHEVMNTSIISSIGSFLSVVQGYDKVDFTNIATSFLPQTRKLASKDNSGVIVGCNSAGVEAPDNDDVDSAFSIKMECVGVGAVIALRIAVDDVPTHTEGSIERPELEQHVLPGAGCPFVSQ